MTLARLLRISRVLGLLAAGAVLYIVLAHALGPEGGSKPIRPGTVRILTDPRDGCQYLATPTDLLKPHVNETGEHVCCPKPEVLGRQEGR